MDPVGVRAHAARGTRGFRPGAGSRCRGRERCSTATESKNASPFSYVDGAQPVTSNVYCEPPEFLTPEERRAFEPIAFQGSLPGAESPPDPERDSAGGLRVYVSFGSVVWRYWEAEALAMSAISEAIGREGDLTAVFSLGGADPDGEAVRTIERPGVAVRPWVDQRTELREADAFITHHGLNSTHEAIRELVPMLSYPFFSDQPGSPSGAARWGSRSRWRARRASRSQPRASGPRCGS